MPGKQYRRLARARRRRRDGVGTYLTTRSSLWLGADHLLNVDISAYSERYKRFYFRDIQGFTIRTTRRRLFWNAVLSILLSLFLLELLIDSTGLGPWEFFLLTLMAFVAAALLINILKGPTCEVLLRTAVQVEELPSLSRTGRARRVFESVRPMIAAAQGQLTPEDVSLRIRESAAEPAPLPLTVTPVARTVSTGPLNLSS